MRTPDPSVRARHAPATAQIIIPLFGTTFGKWTFIFRYNLRLLVIRT